MAYVASLSWFALSFAAYQSLRGPGLLLTDRSLWQDKRHSLLQTFPAATRTAGSTAASLLSVFSPSPSNRCCRCNGRSAKCTRCSCARNGHSCSSCFPASHGRSQNQAAGASSSPSRDEGAPSPAAAHDCQAASATNPAHTTAPASESGAASSAVTASLNTSLSLPPAVNVAAASLAASSSQLPSLSLIATSRPFTLRHVPKGAGNLWFGEVVYATEMHSPQPLRESSLLPILPWSCPATLSRVGCAKVCRTLAKVAVCICSCQS